MEARWTFLPISMLWTKHDDSKGHGKCPSFRKHYQQCKSVILVSGAKCTQNWNGGID